MSDNDADIDKNDEVLNGCLCKQVFFTYFKMKKPFKEKNTLKSINWC